MDLLKGILGLGDNVKQFVTKKVPKLWNQAEDEVKKRVIAPALSFGTQANNKVQKISSNIGQYGLDTITGNRNILPTLKNDAGFFKAPKTTIAKGLYNMGAGVVNSIGTEGVIKPVNDLAQGAANLAYKVPVTKDTFKSGAFKLGADIASGERRPQALLSDAAQTIMPILNAWTGGKAKSVVEGKALAEIMAGKFGQEMQRTALKKIAVETSKTMGKLTGAFTGLQALIDNEDKPITQDIVNAGLSALGGYAGGRALGFAMPYAGREVSGVVGLIKDGLKPEMSKVVKAVINGEETTLAELQAKMAEKVGKFSGFNTIDDTNRAAKELFDKAQKSVVETKKPFTPQGVTANLLQKTEGMPVGMSIKDVSGGKKSTPQFERAPGLSTEGRAIEDAAFKKIADNEHGLIDEFIATNKNVANADEARKLFADVGYAGHNAADVQEPASYINKAVFRKLLQNPQKDVTFYAGGSGSGKSSAINGLFPNLKATNAAILDGNFSSMKSALDRIREATEAGKDVNFIYAYRDPIESLVDGVIKRMLKNPKEGGRLVPVSVIAKNHMDSKSVIDELYQSYKAEGKADSFHFIDNSKGPNKAQPMSYEEFQQIQYPPDLEARMAAEVERLAALGEKNGGISQLQKEKLLDGVSAPKMTPEAPIAGASTNGRKTAEQIIAEVQGGQYRDSGSNGAGAGSGARPGADKKLANMGINTDHLNISDEAKGTIDQAMTELKPTLEKTVGAVMSREEIEKAAAQTAQTLKSTLTREEIVDIGAKAENLRAEIAHLAETSDGKVTPELIDALKRDKEFSSGTARLLQQRVNNVDPVEKTPMLQMIDLVNSKVNDIDAVLSAAQGVDFNDANQAAIFYRQFIKPKTEDWLDMLRYNSMLSSPLTHIVNIGSNLANSGVIAPVEKTLSGAFDFLGSAITGKEREQFAGEGMAHLGGYIGNIGEASTRLAEVFSGKRASTNLDTRNIPLIPGSKTEEVLTFPMKLLEGMDQFFTALTEGGERASLMYREGKGVKVRNMEQQVRDKAAYRIYRQDLHQDGQGTLLDAVDTVTGMIMKARNAENPIVRNLAKWTVPFIKTPMNIFKQGLEYSPVGIATLHGAENKMEQLAKAAIGSAIFMGAGMMLESGRMTWAEPTSEKEKNAFRAAGKQPYSVKIGDTWYSYQKLPPALSFSLAMVAAIDDTQKNAKLDDDTVDQVLTAVAKYGQFLSDQSYAKSIGDLLAAAKGGESGITRLISNYPQQVVPYRALGGWLARLTDDVQRKVDPEAGFIDKQVQLLMQNIPGLSDNTMARTDEFGNEIKNNNNIINSFSPVRTSTENPEGAKRFDDMTAEKRAKSEKKQMKDILAKGGSIGDAGGKSEALKALGDAGNYIYAYDLEKYVNKNEESGIKRYTFESDKATVARNIMEGTATYKDIPDEVKPEIYKAMGLDQHDVEYDYMASQPTDAVAQYIADEMRSADLDHNSVVRALVNGRRASISGKMMVSNAVVDALYKDGFITSQERTALKKVKLGKNGENQSIAAGSGGARKKSVSALITALKNTPKIGGNERPSGKKDGTDIKIAKPTEASTKLETKPFKVEPLSLSQIFQGSKVEPMQGTNIAKARAMVAGSGGVAPGTGLKLSQSFYRGR